MIFVVLAGADLGIVRSKNVFVESYDPPRRTFSTRTLVKQIPLVPSLARRPFGENRASGARHRKSPKTAATQICDRLFR